MQKLQELIATTFDLIIDEEDTTEKQKFKEASNNYEQLQIIVELLLKKKLEAANRDYIELEKQLQKYEFQVRQHIRDEYLLQQNQEDLISRVEELEKGRKEFVSNTKLTIIKLKRENEELYQKLKIIQQELETQKEINKKLQANKVYDHYTQQSTKISQSKYSTLENNSIQIKKEQGKKLKTNVTPQKLNTETSVDISINAVVNQKRLSQQLLKPNYFQKKTSCSLHQKQKQTSKRLSCQFINQYLNQTVST